MNVADILRKIKNNYPQLWRQLEDINNLAIRVTWGTRKAKVTELVQKTDAIGAIRFTPLGPDQLDECVNFLSSLDPSETAYFHPFSFSRESLSRVLSGAGFLCFSADLDNRMVGFFFLRLAVNRECYLGFVVHKNLRGIGLGGRMLAALVNACKCVSLKLLSSVSDSNLASMKSHLKNGFTKKRDLGDGYWLLEANAYHDDH